jgi:hypothetical protein
MLNNIRNIVLIELTILLYKISLNLVILNFMYLIIKLL